MIFFYHGNLALSLPHHGRIDNLIVILRHNHWHKLAEERLEAANRYLMRAREKERLTYKLGFEKDVFRKIAERLDLNPDVVENAEWVKPGAIYPVRKTFLEESEQQ